MCLCVKELHSGFDFRGKWYILYDTTIVLYTFFCSRFCVCVCRFRERKITPDSNAKCWNTHNTQRYRMSTKHFLKLYSFSLDFMREMCSTSLHYSLPYYIIERVRVYICECTFHCTAILQSNKHFRMNVCASTTYVVVASSWLSVCARALAFGSSTFQTENKWMIHECLTDIVFNFYDGLYGL